MKLSIGSEKIKGKKCIYIVINYVTGKGQWKTPVNISSLKSRGLSVWSFHVFHCMAFLQVQS